VADYKFKMVTSVTINYHLSSEEHGRIVGYQAAESKRRW